MGYPVAYFTHQKLSRPVELRSRYKHKKQIQIMTKPKNLTCGNVLQCQDLQKLVLLGHWPHTHIGCTTAYDFWLTTYYNIYFASVATTGQLLWISLLLKEINKRKMCRNGRKMTGERGSRWKITHRWILMGFCIIIFTAKINIPISRIYSEIFIINRHINRAILRCNKFIHPLRQPWITYIAVSLLPLQQTQRH